jgi:hypothetical protein
MSTTNLLGKITLNDGEELLINQEPTDGSAENLTYQSVDGSDNEIYDNLVGKIIKRIQIQASDGSVLTYVEVKQDGKLTHLVYAGERIANSPELYNLDVMVAIPVTKRTRIQVKTGD